jgi:hypothetical protein
VQFLVATVRAFKRCGDVPYERQAAAFATWRPDEAHLRPAVRTDEALGEGGAGFVAKLADLGINQAETGLEPPLHFARHRSHAKIISAYPGGEKEIPQKLLFAARRFPC